MNCTLHSKHQHQKMPSFLVGEILLAKAAQKQTFSGVSASMDSTVDITPMM